MLAHVHHQFAAGQFFGLALHFDLESVAVGDGIVQRVQGTDAGDVLWC